MFTKSLFGAFVFATYLFSARIAASPVAKQNFHVTDVLMFPEKQIVDTLLLNNDEEEDLLPRGGHLMIHRGSVRNCGMDVKGIYKIGGQGVGWVPWGFFNVTAQRFCNEHAGERIAMGHQISATYRTYLTNQKNPKELGEEGELVFTIYNTEQEGAYVVEPNSCYHYMQAPVLKNFHTKHKKNGHGDRCYGSLHGDYEGGYYYVRGIGHFGSEVTEVYGSLNIDDNY